MAAAAGAGGCNWVSLARNAIAYETTTRGEAGNLVAQDSRLYVTLAEDGVAVLDMRIGERPAMIPPAPGLAPRRRPGAGGRVVVRAGRRIARRP